MVLPLIPAVLIAVGAVTGGGGLALGGKGALDLKKASRELTPSMCPTTSPTSNHGTAATTGAAGESETRPRHAQLRPATILIRPKKPVEAKRFGLLELLRERCAIEVQYLTYHVEGVGAPLDLLAAAPHFAPSLAFHHPVMQEALLEEAAAGSRVTATSGPLSGIYAIRVCRLSGWSMRNRRGRSPPPAAAHSVRRLLLDRGAESRPAHQLSCGHRRVP